MLLDATAVVPTGTTRDAGNVGRTKGVGLSKAYCVGANTRPRCPWAPPPSVECTAIAFALISRERILRLEKLGSPWIRVRS